VPAETIKLNSRQGCTAWDASWRIVKLWEVPADDLLATGDIGVVPWVPLAQFDGPPEPVIRECRTRIDQVDSRVEKENLLEIESIAGLPGRISEQIASGVRITW